MGQNPLVAIGAGVLLVVALIWMVTSVFDIGSSAEGASNDVFWYDEDKGKLFGELPDKIPPIEAPSGGVGVRAYVFTTSTCDKAADRYIAYLEKHNDPEAVMQAVDMISKAFLHRARLLRRPDSDEWVAAADSEEGQQIQADYPMGSKEACPQYRK